MNKQDIRWLVVHCSYTPETMDIGAKDIDRWHREKGWLGIGYHKVIRRDGTIEDGRPIDKAGAHVRKINRTSVGVCLIGGMNKEKDGPEYNHTDEQMDSLKLLLDQWSKDFPNGQVRGHTDFDNKKTCPNFDAQKWYETGEIEKTY